MASQFARSFPTAAPVPFLLCPAAPKRSDGGFAAALRTAVAAEKACVQPRNPRQRIARLLCELGKASNCCGELPLSRSALASAIGISVVRVKRTLAMLSLSGVLSCEEDRIIVRDWRKLSGAARTDPADLGMIADAEDELILSATPDDQEQIRFVTAIGEPAYFG